MTNSAGRVVLETSRLLLREIVEQDLDFLATMLGHPEVTRYYPKAYSRDDARLWIERQLQRYREDGHGFWLAVERERALPVGQVGLLNQRVENVILPEVAYMIHRPYWRLGFATEAALAVRDYGFDRGFAEVVSLITPENHPSQRVARKLGMLPRRTVVFAGSPHVVFAVGRDEAAGLAATGQRGPFSRNENGRE